ncbi:MAG: HD domain-containing phosphohydrolase [Acidimicrobiia bacterium]
MAQAPRRFRVSFRITLVTFTACLAIAIAGAILAAVYVVGQRAADREAARTFELTASTVEQRLNSLVTGAAEMVGLGADQSSVASGAGDLATGATPDLVRFLDGLLGAEEDLYSVYYGTAGGAFVQLVRIGDDDALRARFGAPAGALSALREVFEVDGRRVDRWRFLDGARREVAVEDRAGEYDPRARPWYQGAAASGDVFLTAPYVFDSTGEPGVTLARASADGSGVFGADLTLTALGHFLSGWNVSAHGAVFLFDDSAQIWASHLPDGSSLPLGPVGGSGSADLDRLAALAASDPAGSSLGGGVLDRVSSWEAPSGRTIHVGITAPRSDFTGFLRDAARQVGLLLPLVFGVGLFAIWLVSRAISRPVRHLTHEADRVARFEFEGRDWEPSFITEIDSLGRSFSCMTDALQAHIEGQRRLIEAIIELIAGAIDAKSPYTAGHCTRVPQIALSLADAACESEAPPFDAFAMTDDERYEFRIAAWLHDCGKVTTPEYVVDKATKLETIHNRIHEVRTRFEVLLRDARIAALEARLAGEPAATAEARFEAVRDELVAEFAFVAESNIGGELMTDEARARIARIGARTWQRHFDDRLGLSQEEVRLREGTPPEPLPATEPLLADKPWHRVPRHDGGRPWGDNPYGYTVAVPELEYHRGEVTNLGISRGTLTDEERFKINDHVIQTINMLGRLPFPETLRRVPEIAGCHHETIAGTGYPRGLTGGEMSVGARIVAIADVFEALTAADRPYKPAKTLSESLRIMSAMRDEGHVDADLFDLFLRSGVVERYAQEHLRPEQCDVPDVAALAAAVPA